MAVSTIDSSGLTSPLSATNLGTPSAINLSNATALATNALPSGSIKQVLYSQTNSAQSSTSATLVATPLSVTITPTSTSSKIAIFYSLGDIAVDPGVTGGNGGIVVRVYRNGSSILTNANQWCYSGLAPTQYKIMSGGSVAWDAPATTSATTYAIWWACNTGGSYTAELFRDTTYGALIVMEVA